MVRGRAAKEAVCSVRWPDVVPSRERLVDPPLIADHRWMRSLGDAPLRASHSKSQIGRCSLPLVGSSIASGRSPNSVQRCAGRNADMPEHGRPRKHGSRELGLSLDSESCVFVVSGRVAVSAGVDCEFIWKMSQSANVLALVQAPGSKFGSGRLESACPSSCRPARIRDIGVFAKSRTGCPYCREQVSYERPCPVEHMIHPQSSTTTRRHCTNGDRLGRAAK